MAWDKRGYYYRVRKKNGRVVREYLGAGLVAEMSAQLDVIDREQRQLEKLEAGQRKIALAARDAEIKAINQIADLVASAALLAAGYHLHKRGEWRKRRGKAGSAKE